MKKEWFNVMVNEISEVFIAEKYKVDCDIIENNETNEKDKVKFTVQPYLQTIVELGMEFQKNLYIVIDFSNTEVRMSSQEKGYEAFFGQLEEIIKTNLDQIKLRSIFSEKK